MKRIWILISVIALVGFAISCSKQVEPTAQFAKSNSTFTIASTASTVTPTPADSLNGVVPLTWNDPKYAVGLSQSMFTVVVSPTGTNFAKFGTKSFTGVLLGSLLGKDLNKMALQFGGAIGQPIALDIKVVASQVNNNEQLVSNTINVTVTPYDDLTVTPSSTTVVTTAQNSSSVGLTINWNQGFVGYEGSITYELQYAKGGTSFASPSVSTVTGNSKSYTNLDLNNIAALQYGVNPGSQGTVDFRLKATNGESSVIYSNAFTVTITPYTTVYPPIYAMGAAINGWGPWPDEEIILTSSTFQQYHSVVYLTNAGSSSTFRFFAQADWGPNSYNYPYFTTVDANFQNANDGDLNFQFIGTTGFYTISVDLNTKTVALAPADEPLLYMVGQAVGGWDQNLAVKMTFVREGVFTGTTTFTNSGSDATFRFFAQHDWSPTAYNFPYFSGPGSSVDSNFVNANDGDSNFQFTGTTGTYTITVDLNNKTVKLTQ